MVSDGAVRMAARSDAPLLGRLLDAFNREFETPTPGADVIARRIEPLLDGETSFALLAGTVGCAFVTLRPTIWYQGPAGMLEELYVEPEHRNHELGTALLRAVEAELTLRGCTYLEINVDSDDTDARRFYERHGYSSTEPGQDLPAIYYFKEWVRARGE